MANQYKNKIVYDGITLIDLTGDTVTAADVAQGKTFHLPSGAPAVGTGAVVVTEEPDTGGGVAVNITADTVDAAHLSSGVSTVRLNGVTLMTVADTTAIAADVESGKYFYNSAGVKTEGTANARVDLINMTPVTITDHGIDYVITKNRFEAGGTADDTFLRTLQDSIVCPAGSYEFDFGSLITSSNFMLQLFSVTDDAIIYSFGTWDATSTYTFTLSADKTLRIRTTIFGGAVVDEEHELHLYQDAA